MNIEKEFKTSVAAESLTGIKHKLNEDRYRMLSKKASLVKELDRGELFGVFDGIGSAPKGMEAAQKMVDVLLDFYTKPQLYENIPAALIEILMKGNQAIYNWGFMKTHKAPLGGCAGTIAWIYKGILNSFHAGDTCAVHMRNGIYTQITNDHQAPDGAIFRYFGLGPNLLIDSMQTPLEDLDRILMISDGITKVIHPKEAAALVDEYDDLSVATKVLAQRSQAKGSSDDITVMLIEVEEI